MKQAIYFFQELKMMLKEKSKAEGNTIDRRLLVLTEAEVGRKRAAWQNPKPWKRRT